MGCNLPYVDQLDHRKDSEKLDLRHVKLRRLSLPSSLRADQMLLLSQGHLLNKGPVQGAVGWFEGRLGYPLPAVTSVSDYLLDLVNIR
jgi:hypothetical protein